MILFEKFINFFVLLTPFFVLSVFLDVCADRSLAEKRRIATKTSFWVFVISLVVFFFGPAIFEVLGITIHAFQIGGGLVLLLSGIEMIRSHKSGRFIDNDSDPSLIPLALPITVGPGTVSALFVLGAMPGMTAQDRVVNVVALALVVLAIWVILFFSDWAIKILHKHGLELLNKLTGLFLVTLAVQSILNGISTFIAGLR